MLSIPDGLREVVRAVMQEVLEAEMTRRSAREGRAHAGAARLSLGLLRPQLVTRVGKLELRVPQDRAGRFSTELFERYQRSERALVATLAGDVRAGRLDPEGQGDHRGAVRPRLLGLGDLGDQQAAGREPRRLCRRPLAEPFPYLILDARYEKVREAGVVMSQAVLIAVGIDWDGRRQILAVEMANRESRSAWKDFLVALEGARPQGRRARRLRRPCRPRAAIGEVLPEAAWQRCYVHFLRNALDHLPRKHGDDCLQELRWLYDRRDLAEAKADLAAWLAKWPAQYPRLTTGWRTPSRTR